MSVSTAERPTMPGEAELEEVQAALSHAVTVACRLRTRLARIAGDEGVEHHDVPTFEDIGRLFSYSDVFKAHLDELTDYVNEVAESVSGLDIVRETEQVNGRA